MMRHSSIVPEWHCRMISLSSRLSVFRDAILVSTTGDSNMRSVWIRSRNDAIGNLAVIAAAAGVFGTGTGWPRNKHGAWEIVHAALTAVLRSNSEVRD